MSSSDSDLRRAQERVAHLEEEIERARFTADAYRAQLEEQAALYGSLLASVKDHALFLLDASGNVMTWNAGAEVMTGFRREEIVGAHGSVLYPAPESCERELAIAESEGRFSGDAWRVRKNGTQFSASVTIAALRSPPGAVVGFTVVLRDLSAGRAAAEALRGSEERFHLLVDSVTDYAIFMLDATGHIATWNPGAQKNKGYLASEILGRHFSVFYTPEDRAAGRPDFILDCVRRDGRFEDEGWRVRKDGSRFWADVVISALRDAQGEIIGFAKVTRDLTARRAAEENERALAREQLALEASEMARREMERVNRVKDEFLATMSHELRTPLNAISGWATILRSSARDEEKLAHGLEVIERNAKAQTRLISDLLDMSRIINGKLQLNLAKTEMLPLLMAAADVVRPAAEAKGIRLVVDIDPIVGSAIIDGDRIQQIVWNLLTNAVRFTPRGGRVTLTGERIDSALSISVSDSGAGIAPEHLAHVFERFKQIDSSTTREHGGLGLGLAIVRHLADAHGGSVAARSEGLGRGATFTVLLPIRSVAAMNEPEASVGAAEEAEVESRAVMLDGLRVLAIDDDLDSLDVLREVLGMAGAHVTIASNARTAFDALAAAGGGFDLIISDIGMPEMDGYAFIRRVRSTEAVADVPAIALTAYARDADADMAKSFGYQEHIVKPVDAAKLLDAVRACGLRASAKA